MEEREMPMVPYAVLEDANARAERRDKRQWVIILILIAALLLSNIGWIAYECSFTDEIITVEQDSESGYNNYIGNDGDIMNGEAKSDG